MKCCIKIYYQSLASLLLISIDSIEYYYMSEMPYLGGQNDPQTPFQRLDISVGKLFKLSNNQTIDLTLETQLALNKNIDLHQQATADNLFYLEVEYRAN